MTAADDMDIDFPEQASFSAAGTLHCARFPQNGAPSF
jgi:hypothetical protein